MTIAQKTIFALLITGCVGLAILQTPLGSTVRGMLTHSHGTPPEAPKAIVWQAGYTSQNVITGNTITTGKDMPHTYPKTHIIYLPKAANGQVSCYANYEDIAILLVPQQDKSGSRNIWKEGNLPHMSSEYRVEPHASYVLFGHGAEWGVDGPYDINACVVPLKAEKP